MDGKGAWVDNVFVERLWRSLKYEEVYLKAYKNIKKAKKQKSKKAKKSMKAWFERYNQKRKHYGLNQETPDQVYFAGTKSKLAA